MYFWCIFSFLLCLLLNKITAAICAHADCTFKGNKFRSDPATAITFRRHKSHSVHVFSSPCILCTRAKHPTFHIYYNKAEKFTACDILLIWKTQRSVSSLSTVDQLVPFFSGVTFHTCITHRVFGTSYCLLEMDSYLVLTVYPLTRSLVASLRWNQNG